ADDIIRFADGSTLSFQALFAQGIDIQGSEADDYLYGTAFADRIHAGAGNDFLDGGAGDDVLDGGAGNGTYLFGLGYGDDFVDDYDAHGSDIDVIRFGAGIEPQDLSLEQIGDKLLVSVQGQPDRLTIHWAPNRGFGIEQMQFDHPTKFDARRWDLDMIESRITVTNHAPVVADGVPDASVLEDGALDLILPASAFSDPDPLDVLSYAVTQYDGSALPQWLRFDPAARTLSGTPLNEDVG